MGSDLLLAAVAAFVGLIIGMVGVGGVLLISFLALFGGLGIHQASATSLLTFLFTGLLGTWLYQRRGSINWKVAAPVCAGAVVFGYAGAMFAATMDPRPLAIVIAIIIVGSGLYVFVPQSATARLRTGDGWRQQLVLVFVGAGAGFGSGFSGAGGALFSVPVLLVLRYAPLIAIATSQVLQIAVATSGSISNVHHGFIDFRVATIATACELAGMFVGVRLAHAASALALRRIAGALCLVSGAILLVRSL